MERELVATIVSFKNECRFCTNAHAATVIALGGSQELLDKVYYDLENAPAVRKNEGAAGDRRKSAGDRKSSFA